MRFHSFAVLPLLAWYHITSRGTGRRAIFLDDRDREHFVELLAGMVGRYGAVLHAYVLMDNHYHLLIETPSANASRALQWLNLSHSMWFKARHSHAGPVFQAHFKSIPVDGDGSARSCGRSSRSRAWHGLTLPTAGATGAVTWRCTSGGCGAD